MKAVLTDKKVLHFKYRPVTHYKISAFRNILRISENIFLEYFLVQLRLQRTKLWKVRTLVLAMSALDCK